MINLLKGNVLEITTNPIVCLVGGVGYAVYIPEKYRSQLVTNNEHTFYIHTSVKEDAIDLYGFLEKNDLYLFQLLITVSGIGPKTALNIIEKGTDNIKQAISSGNTNFFIGIPRLGTKNAQKIIIELKTKIQGDGLSVNAASYEETNELIDALISMGFVKKDILSKIPNIPTSCISSEQKIRYLIKILGKKIAL